MTHLQEGDKAPVFNGIDQNGNNIFLGHFKGKKIILYFYPQDGTPTCTVQACNLRDNYKALEKEGFIVLGVSPDEEVKHKKFQLKHILPFSLIADTSLTIIKQYGVWGAKQLYGRHYDGLHRTTFIINEKGIIVKIFLKPKSKLHAEEILLHFSSPPKKPSS